MSAYFRTIRVWLSAVETEILLDGVSKGIYFYEVKAGEETFESGKLVVLK